MSNIFHPNAHFNNVHEITPNYLKSKGLSCVLLDIDNTLVPYSVKVPGQDVLGWLKELRNAGLKIVILSNAKQKRAAGFSEGIPAEIARDKGIITIGRAYKPLKRGFRRAERELGVRREEMCIIGDQFFTDILGGNLSKIFSIWVTPIDLNESRFIRSKRLLERPIISSFKKQYIDRGGERVRLLGLIGYPVEHSISPQLHNAVCEITGLNFYYDKFLVKPEDLGSKFDELRKKGFIGLNVTVPHKENIIKYVDEVDSDAAKIGSVNTVVFTNGKVSGYNTDIEGFVKSVQDTRFDFRGSKILILGAGGSARSVASGCIKNGAAKVDFCNRTENKAYELVQLFGSYAATYNAVTGVLRTDDTEFARKFKEYELIVNTTSAGMKPLENEIPIPAETRFEFRKGQLCFDLIYSPAQTLLLKKAVQEGATAINGKDMLFYQGIASFNKWAEACGCSKLTGEQINMVKEVYSKW